MEIPDPPTTAACASCGPLVWLWSARRAVWVAFNPAPAEDRPHALNPHPCRHAQDTTTWKSLAAVPDPGQADINAAGRAAVDAALNNKIAPTEESQP
jgi:hypothetical protein